MLICCDDSNTRRDEDLFVFTSGSGCVMGFLLLLFSLTVAVRSLFLKVLWRTDPREIEQRLLVATANREQPEPSRLFLYHAMLLTRTGCLANSMLVNLILHVC